MIATNKYKEKNKNKVIVAISIPLKVVSGGI